MFWTKLLGLQFLFLICAVPNSFGESNSVFQEGINAYEQSRWDQAHDKFTQLVQNPKWKFAALYNLGNVSTRQKRLGEALGFYRRALRLNPHDRDLMTNLKFVLEGLHPNRPPGPLGTYEIFRGEILDRFSFNEFLMTLFLTTVIFLGVLVKFLKLRKNEEARPGALLFVLGGLFLLVLGLSVLKTFDSLTERATLTSDKVELKSGPGENNASMLVLTEGTEVIVQDSALTAGKQWKQVVAPGGLTGWIPEDSLMATSGEGPW